MATGKFDFDSIISSFRDTYAPFVRAQQEGLKTVERLVRYQLAVTGDYLDWSVAQAKVGINAKTTSDVVSQQSELNSRFGDKLRARAQEFSQIATETQGAMTQWFDQTSAEVVDKVKKAA
jgi:phasin family protein